MEPEETTQWTYNLGDLLKDTVTGMEGIVMVRAEYSTGCHHYGIQQQTLIEGKEPDWVWLDQSRLVRVEPKKVYFAIPDRGTSGNFPSGPKE